MDNSLIAKISAELKIKVMELDDCLKEKEDILRSIEVYKAEGKYLENDEIISARIDKNLERFKKVIRDIRKLNQKL